MFVTMFFFFFSSRRRHTRFDCDWSSDVCSSDLNAHVEVGGQKFEMKPGEACFFPAAAVHLLIVTSERARVLVVYSPPYLEKHGRRALAAAARRTGGGFLDVRAGAVRHGDLRRPRRRGDQGRAAARRSRALLRPGAIRYRESQQKKSGPRPEIFPFPGRR